MLNMMDGLLILEDESFKRYQAKRDKMLRKQQMFYMQRKWPPLIVII